MSIAFQDLNEYDGRHTEYPECNESIPKWREVLADVSVDNAAAVCSGGEVAFFGILPSVRKRLVAIDHAYGSMYYAIGKYHVIEKLGSTAAHKLFQGDDRDETYRAAMQEYHRKLDRFYARGGQRPLPPTADRQRALANLYKEANEGLPTRPSRDKDAHEQGAFTRLLRHIPQKEVTEFRANREKVSFLHGDLNDLIEHGPFDLVYLSNALEYAGRNGHDFRVKDMVKPGGYVAITSSYYRDGNKYVKDFQHIRTGEYDRHGRNGNTPPYGLSWKYQLYRTPA